MAFPEDDVYQRQERSSPKLFTEYSLSAILVIVGQIESFVIIMTLSIAMIFVYWIIILTSTLDLILVLTMICSLAMIPLGSYQSYQAYQLHKKPIHNFTRMQNNCRPQCDSFNSSSSNLCINSIHHWTHNVVCILRSDCV